LTVPGRVFLDTATADRGRIDEAPAIGDRERAMPMSKTYRGERTIDGLQVSVDGAPLSLRTEARTLSRNGFEWGYEGAEPAQLAFAILADHWGDDGRALRHHDAFMRTVVANFSNEWEMTDADIDAALAAIAPAASVR
jgi:hypothetical protein